MAHIFCIANQKGGVGKTTTAVNLAAALALRGQRVLFVDLDPQGNGTMGCGIDKHDVECSVYQLLLGLKSFKDVVRHSESGGFDVLPANRELSGAEIELIDCPPSLSMLTMNALCCAEGVIVPMQCEYFALEGLTDLVGSIRRVHAEKNPGLKIISILRVMFDPRLTLQQQVSEQLKNYFGDKVFNTIIPRNVRLAEAPSYGKPGVVYEPSSRGALAYKAFADELLKRLGAPV